MKFKTSILLIFSILILSLFSCIHWNKKDWNALENRHFTFNEFFCFSKLNKKENIYAYMKTFPEHEIFTELERIYSISINSEEFTSFKNSGSPKDIKMTGLLFNSDFSWKVKTTGTNRVHLKVNKIMSEESAGEGYVYTYELTLKSSGKTRAFFTGEVSEKEEVAPSLLKQLKRKSPMADAKKKPSSEDREKQMAEKKAKEKENKLKNILKDLSPEERELLKKKLQQ